MSRDNSFGPAVCRVCLCGESSIPYMGTRSGEPLISPCHCKGTIGLYHKSCLEHWLYMSKTTYCEICKFRFEYGTKKQDVFAYIRLRGWNTKGYRSLPADIFTPLTFTPLALLLVYYCVDGAAHEAKRNFHEGEVPSGETIACIALAFIVIVTMSFWYITTVCWHLQQFHEWQKNHKLVYIIDQLERERTEQPQTALMQFTESLRRTFCCLNSTPQRFVVSMSDIEINPHMISPGGTAHSSSETNSSFSSPESNPSAYTPSPTSSSTSTSNPSSILSSENIESMRSNPLSTFLPFPPRQLPVRTSTPISNISPPTFHDSYIYSSGTECSNAASPL